MSLLHDQDIAASAAQRETYRLINVSSKLNRSEVATLDALAKSRNLQRGELIRNLILAEIARSNGSPEPSLELTEIIGLRLMLTNLFKPLATGQKLTPEAFDNMLAEVKRRKRNVSEDALQDLERA